MQKNQNVKRQPRLNLIAVDINGDGNKTRIDLGSLAASSFKAYHGTSADGTQVNSMHAKEMGKSLIIRTGKHGPAIAATKPEVEVFSAMFLQDLGYTVTAPGVGQS